MNMKFLVLDSFSKKYDEQTVLDSLSYAFRSKGLYILLGENGSGKSTLLNILSGKDTDYEGKVSYSGEELTEKDRESFSDSCVSYVAQDSLVFEDRKAIDDFLLPYEKKDRDKAKKILTDLGLGDVLDEKCKELSEGEKERLCFGQALYADKEIVLLDEITANLDPVSTERILKNILALSKDRLVIFATHDGMPDWFTKDAFILRRKDGKLSEEQEGNSPDSDHDAKAKKKHGFLLSNVLDARKEEKKTHWVIGSICCVFVAFAVVLLSLYTSCKDTVIGTTVINNSIEYIYKSPLEDYTKQAYLQTARAFRVYSNPDTDLCYRALDTEYVSLTGDWKEAGCAFSGLAEYQPKDKDHIPLVDGKYPTKENEIIISDVCAKNIHGTVIGTHIFWGQYKYLISGIYKAQKPKDLGRRYRGATDENVTGYMRTCYAFGIETVFCGPIENPLSDAYFIWNTKENREFYSKTDEFKSLSLPYDFSYGKYCPACVDDFGNGVFSVLSMYRTWLVFGLVSDGFLLLYLRIFCIAYYNKNKRKIILLRFRGVSRKQVTFSKCTAYLISSSLGVVAGGLLGEITLFFRNLIYNLILQTRGIWMFTSCLWAFPVSLGVLVLFIAVFYLVFNFVLCPRDRSKRIEEVKRK